MKKPGKFTRYQIVKVVLSAVAKTNEQPAVSDRAKQVQGTQREDAAAQLMTAPQ